MSGNGRQGHYRVTAGEWSGGGQRTPYDPAATAPARRYHLNQRKPP
jgi:hypothetical protein